MKEDLIAKISHDLISPINGLGLYLESIEDEIDIEHYKNIREYIYQFNTLVDIYRGIAIGENSFIEMKKIKDTIYNYNIVQNIEGVIQHADNHTVVGSLTAKMLFFALILGKKLLIKKGRLNIRIEGEGNITITMNSNYLIEPIEFTELEKNSRNVMLVSLLEDLQQKNVVITQTKNTNNSMTLSLKLS